MIAKIVLFMCLLLLPTQGWGALDVDQRTIGSPAISGTTQTVSATANSASPLIASCTADVAATSATWNGSAMDVIQSAVADSTGNVRTTLFGMKSPATGTHDFVATFSGTIGASNCAVISTTGGDTTTGWRAPYTRNDNDGTGPGTSVGNSQNGDIVFHAVGLFATTITFDGGEDSTSTEDDSIAGGSISMGLSTKNATGADTPVGATDASFYSEIAVAVIPAGAGASSVPGLMLLGVGQ